MIVTLGILSVFQLVFLPGLIVTRLMKLHGIGNNILFCITLSPIINYLFVFAATALGLYNQRTTLIFFGMELAFLIYLIYPILNKTLGQIINYQEITTFFEEYLNKNNDRTSWAWIFTRVFLVSAISLAIFVILNYFSLYAVQKNSFFTAFTSWDALASWDPWAVDWYNNHFPYSTFHYPQLIPANWSLTYQFMGDSRIKFFDNTFMGFIEIYILLTIFILGMIKRQAGYFFGVIFTAGLQWVYGSQATGYVDSSVAFFAVSSVACLLIVEKKDNQDYSSYIYIGSIFAAGAAVTKQAGLWMVLAYPILLFYINKKKEFCKYIYRYIPGILVIYALMIFPWYGYKEYQILTGKDTSEFVETTSRATQERSFVQQLDYSLKLLQTTLTSQVILGKYIVILLIVLLLFSCGERFYRSLLGLIVIPFTLLWAFLFSYDTRNFNLVVPIIGLSAGIGLQKMLEMITLLGFWPLFKQFSLFNQVKRINIFHSFIKILKSIKVIYLIIPILSIFLLPIKYPDAYMIRESVEAQKEIGNKQLNRKLYKYQKKYGFDGTILTDYQYLGFLPRLEQYYQYGRSSTVAFIQQINQPQVGYALVNSAAMSPKVAAYIDQLIAHKKINVLMKHENYMLVTTCRGPCDK